jgi:hypothetical protein
MKLIYLEVVVARLGVNLDSRWKKWNEGGWKELYHIIVASC